MTDKEIMQTEEDSAWINVDLPFPKEEVYRSISSIERLFRLNPYLEIRSWKETDPGKIFQGKNIHVRSLNEMNGMESDVTMVIEDLRPDSSFKINYGEGLKQTTSFALETLTPSSCRLTMKENYLTSISAAEREARLNEVDKSLVPWGAAIHKYFTRRKRWGSLPFFGWFQDRFWMSMVPRHRRIARLLIWTTILEFIVFLFVFVIYWLELRRGPH